MRKFENLRDERKFDEGPKFQIFEGPKLNLLKLKIEKGGGGGGGGNQKNHIFDGSKNFFSLKLDGSKFHFTLFYFNHLAYIYIYIYILKLLKLGLTR